MGWMALARSEVLRKAESDAQKLAESMASMHKFTRVGVDLAKNVIQVHAVDASGIKVTNKALKRDQFLSCCTQQLPAGCLIAIKGTSGAHLPLSHGR
jgi:hypothetical protein